MCSWHSNGAPQLMWQEGYICVSTSRAPDSSLSSSSLKTSLKFSCVPFHTILLVLPPAPSSVAPPRHGTFCPTSSCPVHPQHRGKARWGLFWQPGDSFPIPHLNMTFSMKRLTFLSHAVPASNYFQLTFWGGSWGFLSWLMFLGI